MADVMAAPAERHVSECSVCFEEFVDPKILPCHHTFCAPCVKKIADNHNRIIRCPTCISVYPLSEVKQDFRLVQFLEALHEKRLLLMVQRNEKNNNLDSKLACELCDSQVYSVYCQQCEQWMCDQCKSSHSKAKVSKGHSYETVHENVKKLRNELVKELSTFRPEVEKHIINPSVAQNGCLQNFEKNKAECLADIERLKAEAYQAVEKYFTACSTELNNKFEPHVNDLKRRVELCKEVQADLGLVDSYIMGSMREETKDDADNILNCTNALSILKKWQKTVKNNEPCGLLSTEKLCTVKKLQSIESVLPKCVQIITADLENAKRASIEAMGPAGDAGYDRDVKQPTQPKKKKKKGAEASASGLQVGDSLGSLLGAKQRLEGKSGSLAQLQQDYLEDGRFSKQDRPGSAEQDGRDLLSYAGALEAPREAESNGIKTVFSGVVRVTEITSPVEKREVKDFSRDLLPYKLKLTKTQTEKLIPNFLRVFSEQLYVPQSDGLLVIYDQNLKISRFMRNKDLGHIYDVTVLDDQQWVVACCSKTPAKRGLFVISPKPKAKMDIKKRITKGDAMSCVFMKGVVVCFERSPPRLHMWRPNSAANKMDASLKTKDVPSRFFAANDLGFLIKHRENLFLYNGGQRRLLTVTPEGDTLLMKNMADLGDLSIMSDVDDSDNILVRK